MTKDELLIEIGKNVPHFSNYAAVRTAVDRYTEALIAAKPHISGALPLVEALDKYIELLVEELNETVSIAATHGWKSSRAEEGERQRNRIAELRRQ